MPDFSEITYESLIAGQVIRHETILDLVNLSSLDNRIIDLFLDNIIQIDPLSEQGTDLQREIYLSCLFHREVTEHQVNRIFELVIEIDDYDEPTDIFSYWWEVMEAAISTAKLSNRNLTTLLSTFLLQEHDESEILPEMQVRLLEKIRHTYPLENTLSNEILTTQNLLRQNFSLGEQRDG